MLLSNLNLLAAAPDGVARLRELILTLAVQGKLVPQEAKDEPVSVLLKKIRAEKDRLMAEGKIKRDKPLAEIAEEEKPFELPQGWVWVRLGSIGLVGSSSRVHQSDWKTTGVPFYRAREIVKLARDGYVSNDLFISEELFTSLSQGGWVPEDGDIMITGVGTIGIPYVVQPTDRFYFKDASVLIFKNYGRLNSQYLRLLMQSPLWIDGIHEFSMGTTVDTLTIVRANIALLPFPPLAEQSRIVTRVEELMRLCDALEAKARLEATQHDQLVRTLLSTLTTSTTPEELADNWHRVATHFDLLLDRPEAVDALEQTILQLAVRGLLVPQDPQDEPASELLQKIRAEKDCLLAEGKIKRDKPLPPTAEDERPFELPHGWEWVRLIDLLPEFQNGASSRGDVGGQSITVLRLADIKNRRISLAETRQIPIAPSNIKKYQLTEGDMLITRVNGSSDIVGQFNLCEGSVDAIYCDHFIRMRINQQWIAPSFCALLGESELVRASIKSLFITTAGQKTVNQSHIGSLLFPLPPLAEQSRIVARVASLRALCADLRQRLTTARTQQALLAEVLVKEVV